MCVDVGGGVGGEVLLVVDAAIGEDGGGAGRFGLVGWEDGVVADEELSGDGGCSADFA